MLFKIAVSSNNNYCLLIIIFVILKVVFFSSAGGCSAGVMNTTFKNFAGISFHSNLYITAVAAAHVLALSNFFSC